MYHVNTRSCRVVTNCNFFIWSYVIFVSFIQPSQWTKIGSGPHFPSPWKRATSWYLTYWMAVEVMVVWVKVYVVEVKLEVVSADEVFMENPIYQLYNASWWGLYHSLIITWRRFYQWDVFRTCSLLISKESSTLRTSRHQGTDITHFSHKIILIQVFRDLKYLPCDPFKKHCPASL